MAGLNAPDRAPSLAFEVDSEHSGVRMVGCLTFLLSGIASFFILNAILPEGGLITAGAAIALAVACTYGADYLSKRFWPSNRYLQFLGDLIQLTKSDQVQDEVDASQDVNLLMWHFEAKRHPRVPKGWYVVASALEQDENFIATYTIASPAAFDAMPLSRLSTFFQRKKGKKDESQDRRKAGNSRRIARAEVHRSEYGAELSPEDYHAYLDYLADTYTDWMPKTK